MRKYHSRIGERERKMIISGTIKCYALGAPSIADIAKECEIHRSNILYYFNTKDNLYNKALEQARLEYNYYAIAMQVKDYLNKENYQDAHGLLDQWING